MFVVSGTLSNVRGFRNKIKYFIDLTPRFVFLGTEIRVFRNLNEKNSELNQVVVRGFFCLTLFLTLYLTLIKPLWITQISVDNSIFPSKNNML